MSDTVARKSDPFAKYERLTADLARFAEKRGYQQEDYQQYQQDLKAAYLDQQKQPKPPKYITNQQWNNWKFDNAGANYISNVFVTSGTYTGAVSDYTLTIQALNSLSLTTDNVTKQLKGLEEKIGAYGIKIADISLGKEPINLANGDTLQITGSFTIPGDGIPGASSKGKGPASKPE